MLLWENIALAFAGLRSNKMRALLTMLGIIIGIGSVIAIVTVGNSLTAAVTSSMQDLGANNIQVGLQQRNYNDNSVYIEDDDLITDELIDSAMEKFSDQLEAVSMTEGVTSGKAQDGRLYANVSITGVNPGYARVNNLDIISGRFLSDRDMKGVKNVAVVSDKLVKNLFGNANPLGEEVKIHTANEIQTYTIVGVYQYEQSPMMAFSTVSDQDISTSLYIPVTTAKKINNSSPGYFYFYMLTKQGVDSAALTADIQSYFNRFYEKNNKFYIIAISMDSMIGEMLSMLDTISIAIAVIAGISLLVGGIGVMNIMLVSITERTREIGTRKALGAKNSSIRMQFIVESVIICLIGGVIGILVGILLGNVGAALLGFPAAPSPQIIVIAVCFSMAIGVFFGYYPANKAAKMDPIEALRYE